MLEEQQDPASTSYHHWLSPEDYADRFGVSQADIDTIIAWVKSVGLFVDDVARGRNSIVLSGTVSDIQRAFRTEIHNYRVGDELHFANSTEPFVPAVIAPLVGGLIGLHDFLPRPVRSRPGRRSGQQGSAPIKPDFTGGPLHSLAPDDLATIYDLTPLYSQGFDGSGQSLVVAGQTDILLSDIAQFRNAFGLSNRLPVLRPVPGSPDPGFSAADQGEANLDLEWSGAVARNATIYYVYSTNVFNSVQYAVNQNLAPVISFSYSICELKTTGTSFYGSVQQVAQQANSQGITWLVSSDDAGAAGCDKAFSSSTATLGLSTNIFASIPEVTGVGGTMFNEGSGTYWRTSNTPTGASAISYIPEIAWNETNTSNGLASSGGGLSIFYARPSWQTGLGISFSARGTPDVAMTAASHDCYLTVGNGMGACSYGTSAAAPSFAGIVAILNQYQVAKGFQTTSGQGNANPNLYRLAQTAGIFHDITQGSNIVPCAGGTTNCTVGSYGYSAGPGYDLVTGLGSVDANALVTQWNARLVNTTTTVVPSPPSFTLNSSTQLTATVRPIGSTGIVNGTVTFNFGTVTLGTATLVNSSATITVYGSQLLTGSDAITALYSGSTSFGPSSGTATVSLPTANSAVVPSVTPSPVFQQAADAQGYSWFYTLTLNELAGAGTTLTGFTIGGIDYSAQIGSFFTSASITPYGSIQASVRSKDIVVPSTVVFGFSGVDAGGHPWAQQLPVQFFGTQISASLSLTSEPNIIKQNPKAVSTCQWYQNLSLQEKNGHAVTITRFTAGLASGPLDLSDKIALYFGSVSLPGFGNLQGSLCWTQIFPPEVLVYEIEGVDENGYGVSATLSTQFLGPAVNGGALSLGSSALNLSLSTTGAITTSTVVAVNVTAGLQWSVALLPANRKTSWLSVYPLSGVGPGSVTVYASRVPSSAPALTNGTYSATLAFQAIDAVPQFVNVPVTLAVSASCSFSLTSSSQQFSASGGPGSVGVTTAGGCSWTAVSNVSWLTIPSGASGTGSGAVVYSALANSGASRTGSMTIAGQTFTVSQASGSTSCTFSLVAPNQSFTSSGGTGSVSVQSGSSSCTWTAVSSASWITINASGSGTGTGVVVFGVAPNSGSARTGNLVIAGMTLTISQAANPQAPLIYQGGIVDGASFDASQPSAAGSIASLFGANLSAQTLHAETVPLPTSLGGVSVLVNGTAAPLFFVSPGQINFQFPWSVSGVSPVSVVVNDGNSSSSAIAVPLSSAGPGIFTINSSGTGQGAILLANTSTLAASTGSVPGVVAQPVNRGAYISIFCTGLGTVSNQPPSGGLGPASPLASTVGAVTATIGGISSAASFAGLAPGFVALYQVNVQVPAASAVVLAGVFER